jgi:type II secretory ATPase GspE/PulE/Tfp pilus assembly ATPase PilB-like protein
VLEQPPPIMADNLAAHGLYDRSAPAPMPRGAGCAECSQTGYTGRVAVVEMLQLNDILRSQLMAGVSLAELSKVAIEQGSLVQFRRSAINLMARHMISPSEALLTLT